MPGEFGDDARGQLQFRIGTADQILHIEVLVRGMGAEIGEQCFELDRRDRLVVVPPDFSLGGAVAHDELVLRRAAGVLAGFGDQRALGGQPGLVAPDRFLVKRGRAEIVAHDARGLQADLVDPTGGIAFAGFRHQVFLLRFAASCRRIPGGPPRGWKGQNQKRRMISNH